MAELLGLDDAHRNDANTARRASAPTAGVVICRRRASNTAARVGRLFGARHRTGHDLLGASAGRVVDPKGKTVSRILITGSNSGFGMLAALSLARAGHDVIATMRNLAKGADLSAAAEAERLTIEVRSLDVCDPSSVAAALHDAPTIDVVVNNAGFEVQGAVELVGDDLMRAQFDTNVLGPMRLIRTVLPVWRDRGHGTIVNVSSVAGVVGAPYGGVYAASKHALEALSEALHFETSQLGIRVRLIEPGRFETAFSSNVVPAPGWEESFYHDRSERFREALTALDGDGPDPDPQDVADAIVAAATDPATPFRTFVGADAQLISGVKASMSFEEFEQTMRATLDWRE